MFDLHWKQILLEHMSLQELLKINWCQDHREINIKQTNALVRSWDGTVVRALTSHQCGMGSIFGGDAIYGFSLLLVLALRVFLWVLRFSFFHKNQHFQILN